MSNPWIPNTPEWQTRFRHTTVALHDGSIVLMGSFTNDVWRLQTAGSTEQHPSHTYTENGDYTVALQVYHAGGVSSALRTRYIYVGPDRHWVYLPLVVSDRQ